MEPTTPLPETPFAADERTMLESFLDYYRTVVRRKAEGLTDEQLRTPLAGHPSPLTVGSILNHLASVEMGWSHGLFRPTPDDELPEPWRTGWQGPEEWEWRDDVAGAELLARFDAAVEHARAVYATAGLDDLGGRQRSDDDPRKVSLRWILVHLVEEHARHAGHLDLLREQLDGVVDD